MLLSMRVSEVSSRRRSSSSERQISISTCSGCRTCNRGWFTCWSVGSFFSFGYDPVRTDVQSPCRVTKATRIEGQLDNLLFDRRQLPRVAIVQQEGATGTAWLAAAVPLLALPSLAMADNIRAVTVGTVEDLDNHDTTRSRWGYSALETLVENSTSTPVRHLHLDYALAWRGGEIRRHYQTRLADALIAATALMHHLRLATRNLQHFTPIEGLQVEKPYD